WCAELSGKDSGFHGYNEPLAKALSTFLAGKRVASFGDGPGQYQQLVTEEGKVLSYAAFDGAPFAEQTSENRVKFLDLAIPHDSPEEVAMVLPQKFGLTQSGDIVPALSPAWVGLILYLWKHSVEFLRTVIQDFVSQFGLEVFDWIVSLEVAEHIP
ncbi:unnamed protein product, partial [Cyprideis torosa]